MEEAFEKSEIVILDGMMVLDRDPLTMSLRNPLSVRTRTGRPEQSIDPFFRWDPWYL